MESIPLSSLSLHPAWFSHNTNKTAIILQTSLFVYHVVVFLSAGLLTSCRKKDLLMVLTIVDPVFEESWLINVHWRTSGYMSIRAWRSPLGESNSFLPYWDFQKQAGRLPLRARRRLAFPASYEPSFPGSGKSRCWYLPGLSSKLFSSFTHNQELEIFVHLSSSSVANVKRFLCSVSHCTLLSQHPILVEVCFSHFSEGVLREEEEELWVLFLFFLLSVCVLFVPCIAFLSCFFPICLVSV